jgi:hypothetical protein
MENNNFYSFKLILKENELDTILNELSDIAKKFIIIMKTKQTKDERAIARQQEFEKLIELSRNILNNSCEEAPKQVYGYGEDVVFDEKMIIMVKRTTIARLARFILDQQKFLLDDPKRILGMIIPYINTLELLDTVFIDDKYFITQFIHCSRGLLDDESPQASYDFMKDLLKEIEVKQYKLSKNEEILFKKVNTFWRETVIDSFAFGKAIEKFKESYSLNLSVEEARKFLKAMVIDFVSANTYNGMVGFNGIILSKNAFKYLELNKELTERLVICIIIHECAHYLLRIVSDDFGFLTPRNGHDDPNKQRFEAGYLLEDILFGNVWKQVWYYQLLMKPDIWEKGVPIISKDDLKSLPDMVKENLCSSGFLMSETNKKI